jgi:uncharacterized membrane protein
MNTWLKHVYEKIQASAWTTPTVSVLLAIILAQITLFFDSEFDASIFNANSFLSIASPDSARMLVSTIASSTLSLAGVAFSSIMVTMTLASQQFGPRLLRNFLKDRTSQICLGVLMGTFVYCLFVIRGPRNNDLTATFIPQISVMTAMALAIVSLGFFIHFVQHVLKIIQSENIISDAHRGLQIMIDKSFPVSTAEQPEVCPLTNVEDIAGWNVKAGKLGYIQAIDFGKLFQLAIEHKAVLLTLVRPGEFLSPLQRVVRIIEGPDETEVDEHFVQKVRSAFYISSNRTPEQDYEYGIRQLVEVALRALSPGINDPFSAMDCIDYLGSALQAIFERSLPQTVFRDDDGKIVRLIISATDWNGLVCGAVDQVRQAARSNCAVSCHLLNALRKMGEVAEREEQMAAILNQAELVNHDTCPEMHNDHDRKLISLGYEAVVKTCRPKGPMPIV